jgi:tRNA A-37 threonylcarbamoyl transferase component Bud32/tetratricopeptide (TPR) repeat protein
MAALLLRDRLCQARRRVLAMSRVAAGSDPVSRGATIAGRYVIEGVLGEGGMACVYAVLDKSTDTRLALKRLKADARPTEVRLFEHEYRILAGLRHPCIVEVYDFGVDAEGAYYTMELVDGRDLRERAPVDWRTACGYLRDAASILGLLHARRLVHRDLGPRNLIEARGGRLKLIDFGALAEFGKAREIAGTPPFIAPEAITTGQLDQRSDMFALGALGYWLITGSHAFPAREVADLPQVWRREPLPASVVVAQIGSDLLEVPPGEIDDLIGTLLRIDPKERISSTAELIDRLNAIAGLPPEAADIAIQGYLQSQVFVGRMNERAEVTGALARARDGRGAVVLVEADGGMGRSRFIQELVPIAQVERALTLVASAGGRRRPYALAERLLAQLHRAAPHETARLCEAHAAVLTPLSALPTGPSGSAIAPSARIDGEAGARLRLQRALLDVFTGVAREHFVAIFVDDLQEVDEESRAFLTALAYHAPGLRLCLVTTAREAEQTQSPSIATLRRIAKRLRLPPLAAEETRHLLRSVFGEVAYLDRLAERLHRVSQGNPAHCLELAQYLVHTRVARYVEGTWTLPTELPLESLPRTRRAGLLSELDRLPRAARSLAGVMSVPHRGSWTVEEAAAAADSSTDVTRESLDVLVRAGVLRAAEEEYVFSHEDLRESFYGEVGAEDRRAIHARLGRLLERRAGSDDVGDGIAACVHFARAGKLTRVHSLFESTFAQVLTMEPQRSARYAKRVEELCRLLREMKQDDYALAGPLAVLSMCGYFADRRYAIRYGQLSIETSQAILRLDLARKLSPWVGRKLALYMALGVAGIAVAFRRRRSLSLQLHIHALLYAASTLAGVAAVCIDPVRAARYAAAIEPFTALGRDHAATLIHDFSALLSLQVSDRPAKGMAAMKAMIERLESPQPVRELTDMIRSSYHAAAYMSVGILAARRDDPEALTIADKLEHFSPLYAMVADHIRATFYEGQGDVESAASARHKMEVHAVQLGSAWQVETWAPIDVVATAIRTNNASDMKRAAEGLGRLTAELPSIEIHELNARISYFVLRAQYAQALELAANSNETPFASVGWTRTQGILARAHNALGRYEDARRICLDALSQSDPEDSSYTVMSLGAHLELAVAEAGLGHFEPAHARLAKLLAQHEPNQSAITLGSIHETRARVSLLEKSFDDARAHLERAVSLYDTVDVPSLVEHARALGREIHRAARPNGPGPESESRVPDLKQLTTRAQVMLRRRAAAGSSARACLDVALAFSEADDGFLIVASHDGQAVTCVGREDPPAEILAWAKDLLARWNEATVVLPDTEDAPTAVVEKGTRTVIEVTVPRSTEAPADLRRAIGNANYLAVELWGVDKRRPMAIAALVIGSSDDYPVAPHDGVLKTIAAYLDANRAAG